MLEYEELKYKHKMLEVKHRRLEKRVNITIELCRRRNKELEEENKKLKEVIENGKTC